MIGRLVTMGFFFSIFLIFFGQFCDLARVATIHKRKGKKEPNLITGQRGQSRHILESSLSFGNLQCKNPVSKYGEFHIFLLKCGELKFISKEK
jgi:hypothetical protein